MQIGEFEDEQNACISAVVRVNGTAIALGMHRLVAFTNERFLRSTAREDEGGLSRCSVQRSSRAGLQVPQSDLRTVKRVLAIMNEEAPSKLSIKEVEAVMSTCKMFMADALFEGLAKYVMPAAKQASAAQVCIQPPLRELTVSHALTHRSVLHVPGCTRDPRQRET